MLVIDAANVIGSKPTGWWRDRPGAARKFVDQMRAATADGRFEPPVVIVLEGAARAGVEQGTADGVEIVHAPGSGDDTLAELANSADDATLVTADRGLRARVQDSGATTVGPSWVYERLDQRGDRDGAEDER